MLTNYTRRLSLTDSLFFITFERFMLGIKTVFITCLSIVLLSAGVSAQTNTDSLRFQQSPSDSIHAGPDTVKKNAIVIGGDTATVHTNSQLGRPPMTAADSAMAAKTKKHKFEPIPKKAGLFSAIVPGTGQIYNRQYWKVPLVYGAAAGSIYFFSFNYNKYSTYKKAYFGRLTNGGNSTADETEEMKRYTTADLKTLQDEYRKYLDMTVMLSALGYAIQVIDAIASAHLKNFDMSRDISFQFKPTVQPSYAGVGVGVGVTMNFK
jgi:hypothetical protein